MNAVKSYIQELEEDGIYLSNLSGENRFIPWRRISHFTLNTREERNNAKIKLKEGYQLVVKINEPFSLAQRIYKVLFNHGEDAKESLPEFEIT
ncbi:MAG: hypothetical protein JXQ87_07200 [Bacteroidia bacterium]